MNIWLINPPTRRDRGGPIEAVVQSLFYNSPPLGLAFLAAVLERAGHCVRIDDCPVQRLAVGDLEAVADEVQPDLVGITSTTSHFDQAIAVARLLRRRLPRATLCLGGPHLNANPDALEAHREFDLGILGEGELTLLEVVERLEQGKPFHDVPGVVSVQDGALVTAPPRPLIEDLDVLPMPARHLLPIHAYRPLPNDQRILPKTSAIVSRGCPFHCIFCDKRTFRDRYRAFSPRRVVEEMHFLRDRYGIRDVAFVDSTFTPDRPRVEAVLSAMEADPPGISWTASCRANLLDEGLLRRMRDQGCWRIRIAIESGNDDILRTIRKGITREQFAHTVRVADALGIRVKAFFMVGHFGETASTVEDSIRFALSLPITDITVQINTPLKGTPQYDLAPLHGTLRDGDTRRVSFFEPVFVPHGMTAEQLLQAHRSFYRRFYLRPVIFWRMARAVRRPSDVTRYLRAVPLAANVMFTNRSEKVAAETGKGA